MRHPGQAGYVGLHKYTPVPFSDVIIGISQSGETADTLSAIRKGICNNVKTVVITNVLNSSITRSAHDTILMHAGPEISVAASKSFIAQVGVLMQIVNILSGDDVMIFLTMPGMHLSRFS